MARSKKEKCLISGNRLVATGDHIQVMDNGKLILCKVLSCLLKPDGACLANLEILEGENKGHKIETTLRATEQKQP